MGINMEREYLIIKITDIDKIIFDEILQTSKDTVRRSIDNTKFIIKYNKYESLTFINLLNLPDGPYTHDEIIDILQSSEWTIPQNKNILLNVQ